MIADAIRLHVIAATPEQASDAAHDALQRLEDEGIKSPRRQGSGGALIQYLEREPD
jgi:hypothetical protein